MTDGAQIFASVAMKRGSEKWDVAIAREGNLYERPDDPRSHFARDYNRLLHCTAYRRLRHKTQVFFATRNDHICTRIEHVNHVTSVSYTIAKHLGLNTELTNAIALGHDLGHAPFGHEGEKALAGIVETNISGKDVFWHEQNSLRIVDKIETLESPTGAHHNLMLTYAVRDGIVCHSGEIDETTLAPRSEAIDLYSIKKGGETSPFSWEGCVVKISDKISYLGRDIEDAITLNLLDETKTRELEAILKRHSIEQKNKINNTLLIHNFVLNVCENSSPEKGISLLPLYASLMKEITEFNYKYIYAHRRVERYKKYVRLVMETLYEVLFEFAENYFESPKKNQDEYPTLAKHFDFYIDKYSLQGGAGSDFGEVEKIYNFDEEADVVLACVDFLSGMTDNYALELFEEVVSFR